MKENKIHIINISLFCLFIFLGGFISIVSKKQKISSQENRNLASFPVYSDSALWNGSFFRGIELYYADNFPFRNQLIDISTGFKNNIGFRSSDIVTYISTNQTDPSISEFRDSLGTGSDTTTILTDDGENGEIKKNVFVFKNRAFEMFRGSPAIGAKYAEVLNSYQQLQIPQLQIYSLLIPLALEFEITEKYKHMQSPNRPAIEKIYEALDPSIKKVWAIDEIRQHRNEYIYFNTDHHWTSLGAYYAYRAFCSTANLNPVSLDTVSSKVIPDFLGSLYRLTKDPGLKENVDSVRYYLFTSPYKFYIGNATSATPWIKSSLYAEGAKGSNSYSVFIQGDLPVVKIETEQKNGRKLIVVKESYGNAFVPYLLNNYEKIIVVDQRHFKGNIIDLINNESINELLFINNLFAAHTPFHINLIKGLKNKK